MRVGAGDYYKVQDVRKGETYFCDNFLSSLKDFVTSCSSTFLHFIFLRQHFFAGSFELFFRSERISLILSPKRKRNIQRKRIVTIKKKIVYILYFLCLEK